MDLKKYQEKVITFSTNNSPEIFSNEGPEHAIIVLSELFKKDSRELVIYSGELTATLTDNPSYKDNLIRLVKKGTCVKILVEKTPQSPVFEELKDFKNENSSLSVRKIKPEFIESIKNEFATPSHFAVVDGMAFRLEINTEKRTAFCSFNNTEVSGKLLSIFNKYNTDTHSDLLC